MNDQIIWPDNSYKGPVEDDFAQFGFDIKGLPKQISIPKLENLGMMKNDVLRVEYTSFTGISGSPWNQFVRGCLSMTKTSSEVIVDEEAPVFGNGIISLEEAGGSYLKLVLSGGVLLEAGAASKLIERGFSEYIGINSLSAQLRLNNLEIIKTFTRPDGTHIRIPSRISIGCWYKSVCDEKTEILSEFADPRGNRSAAMTYFENSLGGRVAVYHARSDFGTGFFTHNRVKFIKDVIARLAPNIPRIDCNSYLLTTVRENEVGDRYYFVANLSTDAIDTVTLDGDKVDIELAVYGAAIFERKDGKLRLIAKAKT